MSRQLISFSSRSRAEIDVPTSFTVSLAAAADCANLLEKRNRIGKPATRSVSHLTSRFSKNRVPARGFQASLCHSLSDHRFGIEDAL
jgi:hypothetical protein